MKAESEPITNDEWLLRRVHKDRFKTDKIPLISANSFEPRMTGNDIDYDGISLYRLACQDHWSAVLATIPKEKQQDSGIVKVPVAIIQELGFTIQIKPDSCIKGHVVIPELNANDYAENKVKFVTAKLKLATEASRDENILLWPPILKSA